MFSGLVNYRHLIATSCAAAVAAGTLAAPAQAAVDPIGAECRAATAAANMGQPIPNIGKYLLSSNENAIDGNLLRIYAPEKYKPYITEATNQWANATDGLMRFEFVDQPGYKVVTVREANLGGYVVGRVQGNVNNMELLLNPDILRNGYYESLVMTIAHELGHAMGLAHSCDGALMKDGTNRGKVAKTPQPLDAQVLIQANNLAQYKNLPLATTTAAPAPETSAPVEPSPDPSVAPATEFSSEPSTSTAVADEPEPSAPAESSATTEAKTELPKPSSLAEAEAVVRQTASEYFDAWIALTQAQMSGVGVGDATAQFQEALDRYAQATENRDEYVAAHPDGAVESSTSSAPTQQPTSATETTVVEPTATTATSTTASTVTSAPSSTVAAAPKSSTSARATTVVAEPSETATSAAAVGTLASTSEEMPTSTSEHRTVAVTGEQNTTTLRVQPTLTTRPVVETTTSAVELPREITTVTIDVTVPATPQDGDEKEALVGGSSVGILIPIIVLLLGTLGAAGWAYVNGLF